MAGDTGTLGIQASAKGIPVGKPEHPGDACLPLRLGRQHLGLAVINGLQGVLGVAQKAVGLRQFLYCRLRQIAVRAQRLQHAQNGPLLQAAVAATVNQLEGLTDKLDLTDTARAQLDVVLQALALHFTLNHLLEVAQRIDSGKVQITAIDKGPQHGQQLGASLLITRHHPRLDHRVALPVPALALVVLLQRIKAEYQSAAVTIRAQAHIDAKHKAVHGWRIQRLDQLLPQANKKLLIGQAAPPAASLAGLRVGKDQVDVRGQVKLHRAQLTHAQHHHMLRRTVAAERLPQARAALAVQPLIGLVDAGIRHIGQVARGLLQRRQIKHITPDDAHLLPLPKPTQRLGQLIFVSYLGQRRLQQLAQFALSQRPPEPLPGHQPPGQLGITTQLLGNVVTGRQHQRQLLFKTRAQLVAARREGRLLQRGSPLGQMVVTGSFQRGRQRRQCGGHGLSCS